MPRINAYTYRENWYKNGSEGKYVIKNKHQRKNALNTRLK